MAIIRIYCSDYEYRVAHTMLLDLCKQFPDDPYLQECLAKLYLDIGKKEQAVRAFKKAEEIAMSNKSFSADTIELHKHFNEY